MASTYRHTALTQATKNDAATCQTRQQLKEAPKIANKYLRLLMDVRAYRRGVACVVCSVLYNILWSRKRQMHQQLKHIRWCASTRNLRGLMCYCHINANGESYHKCVREISAEHPQNSNSQCRTATLWAEPRQNWWIGMTPQLMSHENTHEHIHDTPNTFGTMTDRDLGPDVEVKTSFWMFSCFAGSNV